MKITKAPGLMEYPYTIEANEGEYQIIHVLLGDDVSKNQAIFNMLSELEQALFYKSRNPEELKAFQLVLLKMHDEAKTLLIQWHNLTGCVNEE